MKKLAQVLFLTAAAMMPLAGGARAEEFYETRLHAGETAYLEKRLPEALDNLRIAAFGLLDHPPQESEALVYLSLVQTAVGRGPEADVSLGRFLDVEGRFAPYAKLKLDAGVRAEFQALLLKRVSQQTLLAYPGLSGLVETEEQKIGKLPPKDRAKAYEAAARREPRDPKWALDLAREASSANDPKATIQWATKAIELDPGSVEGHALRAHALVLRGECVAAKPDFDAVGSAETANRPTLAADRFVCLVEAGDWAGASEASGKLAASQMSRPDVVRAQQRLAASKPASR